MAATFPMPLADFWGDLCVQVSTPDLTEALQTSRTAGGGVTADSIADRLWACDVQLAGNVVGALQAFQARANILREAGRSLLVGSIEHPFPASDPGGVVLAAAVPRISSLEPNNRELSLSDLPAGYVISAGDFVGFQYGANPVRYAYHQVAFGSAADVGGLTGQIEVTPHIRPGAVVGATVSLIRPVFKGVMVPGSYRPGSYSRGFKTGPKFSVIQTLR